ncbi:MAG: alpha/beta hydrolase [Pseudomonadota bacterium]
MAHAHGWQPVTLNTGGFLLRAYGPEPGEQLPILTVYLEGDGLAWVTRSRPSTDPTPVEPIGLQLALADPQPQAVYLARPCQYITSSNCRSDFWLGKRFSAEVIDATGEALDGLKARYKSNTLLLVGYSGGGAVAALLAAERDDVDALITVAGNLDHDFWTRHHRISPLKGSMNPADRARMLADLSQWHFIGGRDDIVPSEVAGAYIKQLPHSERVRSIVKPAYGHQCCWVESWPGLISQVRSELNSSK